ncbi:MAG: hypothetical protein IKT46_02270 [Clostridia bacterium]|nr:hypothetical protein [Clostridia bacterium]
MIIKKVLVLFITLITVLNLFVSCSYDNVSFDHVENEGYAGTWNFSHVWDSEKECETRPLTELLYDTIIIYPDGTGTGINVYDNGKSDETDFNWEIEEESDGVITLKVGINSGVFFNKNICYLVDDDVVAVFHGGPTEFAYYVRS